MNKKRVVFIAKLVISLGIVIALYSKVIARQGAADLWHHLSNISWGWVVFGVAMQLCAVACSVIRWQRLLVGQGIHAPLRHLIGSFMIGRFFGEFAPGGWTGLNGYRIYDIATHTGKLARATACIGIEMVLGWLSFGAVVIAGSVFGLRFIGLPGVLLVDAFFLGLIVTAIALVTKPVLFRVLASRLPDQVAGKLRTTVDAVCAYDGKGGLVAQAAALGVGTHFFRAFIYVGAAHALSANLGVGEVFFGSSLQIFATFLPASINGIGLREATAVALYTRIGVADAIAVLIPTLGFLIEMFISSFGGLVFMARRVGYKVEIRVDHAEHEDLVAAALPPVPESEWPKRTRGLSLGLGAGLFAGALLGIGEALVILRSSAAEPDYGVIAYATVAYSLLFGAIGSASGFSIAWSGRLMQRTATPDATAYARLCAALVAAVGFAITAFRVRRDYYHEELVWKSGKGLLVLGGCALAAVVLYVIFAIGLRLLVNRQPGQLLLRAWGTPAFVALFTLLAFGGALAAHHASAGGDTATRAKAPAEAGNILFIVVDTLRADHLPNYGYASGITPNLELFSKDAVRFEHAFANASWTRPSFASILTGRYPASHRTMTKSDALPGEVVTVPEALRDAGYHTGGIVTNFNVAPFFNFQQGFDEYRYLEPNFVLGANDTAAKLLFIQFFRQRIETVRAKSGRVEVGSAYQDASVVNRNLFGMLDAAPHTPWFMFVGYMDPHDPYYPHPYNGTAYARAAHQEPNPDEAPALRKLYDGEITYWDEHFGALITELKRRGVYDELTIVVTADHGEEFHEHGGFWHGTTLYDEQVRIPLWIKLPAGELRGNVVKHWVQSIDLMPTLLKRAGVAIPPGVQGRDVFAGNSEVFAEESHEGNVLRALRIDRGGAQLKLITANPGNPRGLAPREFYRMDQDPAEKVNLAEDEPALVEFTRKALDQHEEDAAKGRASQQSVDVGNDPNAAARLRALGYAGGDKPN
jgi:arylsulfatase A-like enzyme/uncharacterized membrane protein YbhN (UPF0104 family)